jgi:Short C-terminal domain
MVKRDSSFPISRSLNDVLRVCREVVAELRWNVLDQRSDGITCKQGNPSLAAWPVTMRISLSQRTGEQTIVNLEKSCFGFGSIQSNYIMGQLGQFRNRIELRASQILADSNKSPNTLADEIQRLAELHKQGILSQREFEQAKTRLLS